MRALILILTITSLAACTWVKPSDAGAEVALVKPAHIHDCEKIGSTTSKVKQKVGIIERKEQKVMDELITLAKNEAARVGGDTILAKGSNEDDEHIFDIYRCGK